MNKSQLVSAIAKNAKLSKKSAGAALEATLDSISDVMRKGQKVALVGFGTFGSVMRKARRGLNPITRQPMKIAAKRVPKFKAGKHLKKVVSKLK